MIPRTLEPEVMDSVDEAVDYDAMDHSGVNALFVQHLLQFIDDTGVSAQSLSGQVVADLGTGTALIPLELLRVENDFGQILACDLSIEMLRIAAQHIHKTSVTAQILPVFCDCKVLPFADASCDILMSNSILHHIPEPLDVFREIRRTIRPGGVVFIRDLMRPTTGDEIERLVATYAGNDNAHQQQLFRQSMHAAFSVGEIQDLLGECGFDVNAVRATSDRHWTVACPG